MVTKEIKQIFKSGSKTYFTSSLFFPKHIRDDLYMLYAFVRTFDDFVDKNPPDIEKFNALKKEYYHSKCGILQANGIVNFFHCLEEKYGFDSLWTDAFIKSMEEDISVKTYETIEDVEKYMYGSANVIGLYMSKLLNLPSQSYRYAEMLGKSMQFLNFIRDIDEDLQLGRTYFPQKELRNFGLQTLRFEETSKKPKQFKAFMRHQLTRYGIWQKEAEKGFEFIPSKYLIPIKTASDMYKWTGDIIKKDPFIVYRKKVKPSALRICLQGMLNTFSR